MPREVPKRGTAALHFFSSLVAIESRASIDANPGGCGRVGGTTVGTGLCPCVRASSAGGRAGGRDCRGARQNFNCSPSRTPSGEPGVMLLLLCAKA